MKSAPRPAFGLLVALLFLSPVLRAEDSPDVVTLRTKAEQGNSIAQYNLGLAYSRGAGTEVDLPEAFVWLTLASENGTKGPALEKTMDALTPAQLSEAKRRLDARRTGTAKPATTPAASAPAAAVPAISAATAVASSLQTQLDEARQNISRLTLKNQELEAAAANPASSVATDADKKIAETEDKLATSLRSYTLLRDENDQLKADADKASSEKTSLASQLEAAQATIANLNQQLTSASATAAQSTAYHDQLRQTQDQLASVSSENSELRGRLAATSTNTGALLSSPTRPGAVPTGFNPTPLPAFQPEPAPAVTSKPASTLAETPAAKVTPAGDPATSPAIDTSVERTHIVAAGETLSGIALRYYGNSLRWAEILEANRTKLHDEKSLRVGMKLRIPALH